MGAGGIVIHYFSMLNRIALNLIKHEQSKKRRVKGKRLDAGWNNNYLLKILKWLNVPMCNADWSFSAM
jgi:hypothetical protein